MIGYVDGVFHDCLAGWAWNHQLPAKTSSVDIFVNGEPYKTVVADQFRQDLKDQSIGTGFYGFNVPLDAETLKSVCQVSVRISGTNLEIGNSPLWLNLQKFESRCHLDKLKIDPFNIQSSLENLSFATIGHLLIDINDTCNADCVYCGHSRSKQKITLKQFQSLLSVCFESVDVMQIGCGQEPTANLQLADYFKEIKKSAVRAKKISMITNATLLDRHDVMLFSQCGLNEILVSIDTVDEAINSMTRRGTDLNKIKKNLEWFRNQCPDVRIVFSVVVNALTVDGIEELVNFGDKMGVSEYIFREVSDNMPENVAPRNSDYKDWIGRLSLEKNVFRQFENRLRGHPSVNKFTFLYKSENIAVAKDMRFADTVLRIK